MITSCRDRLEFGIKIFTNYRNDIKIVLISFILSRNFVIRNIIVLYSGDTKCLVIQIF